MNNPPRTFPVFQASPVPGLLVHADAPTFSIYDANEAYLHLFGLDRTEIIGTSFPEELPTWLPDEGPELVPQVVRSFRRVLESRQSEKMELCHITLRESAGSRPKILSCIPENVPISLDGENATLILHCITDVTELWHVRQQQERMQNELTLTEMQFRSVFEHAATGMALVGLDLTWLEVNETFCRFLGYSREQLRGKKFIDFGHPDDQHDQARLVKELLRGQRETLQMEKRYRHRLGHFVWGLLTVSLLKDAVQQPKLLIAQIVDIQERKQAEQKLKDSEQRYESLFRNNPDAVYLFDLEGRFISANQTLAHVLGLNLEQLMHRNFLPFVHPEDRELVFEKFRGAANGSVEHYVGRAITETGRTVSLEIVNFPMKVNGIIMGVYGVAKDITDRLVNERSLQAIHHERELILQSSVEGIYGIDTQGRCTFINETALNLLGYTESECLGKNLHELFHYKYTDGRRMPEAECLIYKNKDSVQGAVVEDDVFWKKDGSPLSVRYGCRSLVEHGETRGMVVSFSDISERKRAEEQLSRSERRFRNVVQNGSDLIAILDREGRYQYLSPNMADLLGESPNQLTGTPALDRVHPDDRPAVLEDLQHLKEGERMVMRPFRLISWNGTWRWMEVMATQMFEDPAIQGIVTNSRDITERLEVEQDLRESEQKYRMLFQFSPIPKLICDVQHHKLLDANDSAVQVYELDRMHLQDLRVDDMLLSEEHDSFMDALNKIQDGVSEFGMYRMRKGAGELLYMEVYGHAFTYQGIPAVLLALVDVTQREIALEKYREHEAKLLTAQKIAQLGYWELRLQDQQIYFSDMVFTLLGTDRSTLHPDIRSVQEYVHASDRQQFNTVLQQALQGLQTEPLEIRILYARSLPKWVRLIGHLIRNRQGEAIRFEGTLQDIDEQRRAAEAIRLSNERYTTVSKATNDSIWDWDLLTNRVERPDKKLETLLGYAPLPPDQVDAFWNAHAHPEDWKAVQAARKQLLEAPDQHLWKDEYRFRRPDGSYAFISDRGYILRNDLGKPYRIIGASRDISQIRENEHMLLKLNEQLQQHAKDLTESNAQLEQFAYVASHDLQEPLRMITSFLGLIEKRYEALLDEKGKQYIHFAVDGARRMRQMILDLLEYSRAGRSHEHMEWIDMNALIQNIMALNRKQIQESHAQLQLEPMPKLLGYRVPVEQVFRNLISNAFKYRHPKRSLKVTISVRELPDSWEFCIQDNGIGIEAAYHERIFQIFQRLHGAREYSGSGLGLAIVRKIVDSLDGKVWVDSEPDKGSRFYVQLPKLEV